MRGTENSQVKLFHTINVEELIPQNHPIRGVKALVDLVLDRMNWQFDALYVDRGRPSIPPEQLLRAFILQKLYSIRSERQLEEMMRYNLMYRWFVGLNPSDAVWDHSTFSRNAQRLVRGEMAEAFLLAVVELADAQGLLSNEHFTVDGTLLEAAASMKSVKPKDKQQPPKGGGNGFKPRNPDVDFKGQKRSNQTHRSTTDPEALLYRKSAGQETKLCFMGHHLMDNRHGLVVEARASRATGTAEVENSEQMLTDVRRRVGRKRLTVGEDKGYDQKSHVTALRQMKVTPHIAVKKSLGSGLLDGRNYCKSGYHVSQKKRRRVEETFGWGKVIGGLHKLRHVGLTLVNFQFTLTAAVYNLVRIRNLLTQPA
jgi:transposase